MKSRIIKTILIIVSIIFLIWFLIPCFTSVGLKIGNATGIGVFAVLLLYGIFFDQVNQFLARLWKKKWGKVLELVVAVILAAVISLAAVTYGCMLHAAGKGADPGATAIVLGCKVNKTAPSLTLLSRLNAAYNYLTENPESYCIVSGGQGEGEDVTEASAMQEWLIQQGIDPSRIYVEDRSLDTSENISFSHEIIRQHPELSEKTAIVTNDFHMYRALLAAEEDGLDAGGVSADTPWWLYPTYVVREMYGILESWFLK